MDAKPAHLEFDALQGRVIEHLRVRTLDQNGKIEFGKGEVKLSLDHASDVAITFDYDLGLVLREGQLHLPSCKTLSDWFDLQRSIGVLVRTEFPEGDLRAALYGATIEAVAVENDPHFPHTPIRLRIVTGSVVVLIGVEGTICTVGFELRR